MRDGLKSGNESAEKLKYMVKTNTRPTACATPLQQVAPLSLRCLTISAISLLRV